MTREKLRETIGTPAAVLLPNISLFLAYGLLTLLPLTGAPTLAHLLLTTLIPAVLAAQGGRHAAGERGAAAAVLAMLGLLTYSTTGAALIGALILGPLSGAAVRAFDNLCARHIPNGMEMLTANFSAAGIGILFALVSRLLAAPALDWLFNLLMGCTDALVSHGLLPLSAFFIEPLKLLFLNNTLNHGLLSPLGAAYAGAKGWSILYLLESNPGPGFGLLLAICLHARTKADRAAASGAAAITLLGGIHELYFPYILARPRLILAPMLGNAAAIMLFGLLDVGLTAPASPGSIITLLLLAPPSRKIFVFSGTALGAVVSFFLAQALLHTEKSIPKPIQDEQLPPPTDVHLILFVCDAGFGSSALGAATLQKRFGEQSDIKVNHASIHDLPIHADLIVCQRSLCSEVRARDPDTPLWPVDLLLGDPLLDRLVTALCDPAVPTPPAPYPAATKPDPEDIVLGLPSVDAREAIIAAGQLLTEHGYVDPDYISAMLAREAQLTTCVGLGVAIPHGTVESRALVRHAGIVLLQYPNGVNFGGETVHLVFGLAAPPAQHLLLLERLADLLEDPETLAALKQATDPSEVRALLRGLQTE